MLSPRLSRLIAASVALAGLLAVVWAAPGQPPGKEKKSDKKKREVDNTVKVTNWDFYDYCTVYYPYKLKVFYTAGEDGLRVAIAHPGKATPPQSAPVPDGDLEFCLDFAGDTTGADVTANLETDQNSNKASHAHYGVNFVKDGQNGPPFDLRTLSIGGKPAQKAAKPGDPIPPGTHIGHFPSYAARDLNYRARIRVQGRFEKGPLKPEYDLPADLLWWEHQNRWYPIWILRTTERLTAQPLQPKGEKPLTVMQPILLDQKGKVLHIMTHKYW